MQEKIQNISSTKQRILSFVDILGISKREFYLQTGISRGTLESNTGITEETLAKFIAKYPQINLIWLLLGVGEMIQDNIKRAPPEDTKCSNCEILEEKLREKDEIISNLKATLEDKSEIIADKIEIIRMLKQKVLNQDNIEKKRAS